MMKNQLATFGKVLVLGAVLLILTQATSATAAGSPLDRLSNIQKRLLSGFASYELNANNATNPVPPAAILAPAPDVPTGGGGLSYKPGPDGCPEKLGNNVKVNQNCLNLSDTDLQGRGQAENETAIASDPNNPGHLVATSNDYLRGDSTCGAHISLNNGQAWEDVTMPNGFVRGAPFGGAREYFQASGDPSIAWDSRGNAYYSCQMFMRGQPTTNNADLSSAVYVFRSTKNEGASWNFPAHPVVINSDPTGTSGVLEDKPYMSVDNSTSSSFRDRIYVTWTEFAADGSAYIWESHSNDYGQTFSSRVLVSGNNTTLCTVTFGAGTPQGNCNENQFSQPFTGPDGNLYVVFANFNNTVTGSDNRNQMLLAKSTDGGATFSLPVKVADYYDLPDCATYQAGQDNGRACVPEKGSAQNSVFRATNYPSGGVNPKNPKQVAVTFGSYINKDSKEPDCVPAGFAGDGDNTFTGVKTAGGCDNKILISVSNDAGATFTGTTTDPRSLTTVNQEKDQAKTDQWFQWADFSKDGKLAVSYYDRQYGSDETSGKMDVSVSGSSNLSAFATKRATSASMPLPTQFPDSMGNSVFFGDYSGLTADNDAHPLWSDARDADRFLCSGTGAPGVPPAVCNATEPNGLLANDQDIFTVNMGIPTK